MITIKQSETVWIIGMKEEDDGHKTTSSDIYAINIQTKQEIKLTNTTDEIEMYPACSTDGKRIVYHTEKGEIGMIELN